MSALTEKWKAGELEWHKSYYCKDTETGKIVIAMLEGDNCLYAKELCGELIFGYWDVLAPCDYEELDSLKKENIELKELLKECRPYIRLYTSNNMHVGFTPSSALLSKKIEEVLNEY